MRSSRRYRQLQLQLASIPREFTPAALSFRLARRPVEGVLHGDADNWTFESSSPVFLQHVPSGRLDKYALWFNKVPPVISELYDRIYDAALKAGFSLQEKEEG